jgi:hypothetical protein
MSRAVTGAGLVATAAVTLLACATTTFHSTWRSPASESLNFRGKRVAALILSEEEALRFAAEDALAREITAHGGVGVPSYTLLPKGLVRDKEKARELLEKADVEGVVELRPRTWDESLTADAGTYWGSPRYASFWGSGFWGWGWGWGGADHGHLPGDTTLVVETLVYSLPKGKLVWACQSRTMIPSQVGPFIHELSTKAGTEMEKQGLFREPALASAAVFPGVGR